jgi:vacuolar-type H+-ATPase subunit D/Vma8
MTRSNLHIKLSNGKSIICVADSSSAPEQGYIVEQLLLPLLSLGDSEKELALLAEHCTMNDRRVNATYRYVIDLTTKEVRFYEERYNYRTDTFHRGKEITERYNDYLEALD